VGQGLKEEAFGQRFVVDAGRSEEAVEGALVGVREAEGQEGLGNGAPGESEEVAEYEGLRPKEGALLAEGAAVG
jgi:hypothetical protein